jgi:hypothetical protein
VLEQHQSIKGYAEAYTDHSKLKSLIPSGFTTRGHRTHFQGIPWPELVEELPALKEWYDSEVNKKVDRLFSAEQDTYAKDEKAEQHELPFKHVAQTAKDKACAVGQFFAFIRLIEGKEASLLLEDVCDIIKVKTFIAFVKGYSIDIVV